MTLIEQLRECIGELTPLRSDCGRLCGAACCASMEGEETGMRLIPGEEANFTGLPDYRILRSDGDPVVVCSGQCDRDHRPLSCMIFPLLPVLRDGQVRVITDERARAVCPLARLGKDAMLPDFTAAVEQLGHILCESDEGVAFLTRLTEEQDQLRAWRRQLTGR